MVPLGKDGPPVVLDMQMLQQQRQGPPLRARLQYWPPCLQQRPWAPFHLTKGESEHLGIRLQGVRPGEPCQRSGPQVSGHSLVGREPQGFACKLNGGAREYLFHCYKNPPPPKRLKILKLCIWLPINPYLSKTSKYNWIYCIQIPL